MAFRLIGELFGKTAEILGYQKQQGTFILDGCPVLQAGETHPHLIHSTRAKNEDIVYLLNFVIDVLLIGTKDEIEILEKLHKTAKNQNNKIQGYFDGFYKKVSKKLGRFPKQETNDEVIKFLAKEIKEIKTSVKRIDESNEGVTSLLRELSISQIKSQIDKALKEQNREIKDELSKLKYQVKDLILEVKFDPDNPKSTEIRTEENFKQILKLSERVTPLIEEVSVLLKRVDKNLDKALIRIG